MQTVSFNTLGDLSLVYCIFFILKRGCVQKQEIWKAFSIPELPALLPLSAPFNLVMFFIISSNTRNTLSHRWDTNIGLQTSLVYLSASWADACASCYSSEPRDKCQSWHERSAQAWGACYCLCVLLTPGTERGTANAEK